MFAPPRLAAAAARVARAVSAKLSLFLLSLRKPGMGLGLTLPVFLSSSNNNAHGHSNHHHHHNYHPHALYVQLVAHLRSFLLLSILFAPVVFYILFISSHISSSSSSSHSVPLLSTTTTTSTSSSSSSYYSNLFLTLSSPLSYLTSSSSSSSSNAANPLLFPPVLVPPGHIPAPRHALQHSAGLLPLSPAQDPTIRLLFACDAHNPCCDTTFTHSLRAALTQTLAPNHVTLLHGCTDEHAHRADPFIAAVRAELSSTVNHSVYGVPVLNVSTDDDDTSINNNHNDAFLTTHVCTTLLSKANNSTAKRRRNAHALVDDMESCVIRYLASTTSSTEATDVLFVDELAKPAFKPNSFVMVVTPSFILEPTALESMWLYLFLHPPPPSSPQSAPLSSSLFHPDAVAAVRPLLYNTSTLASALTLGDPLKVSVVLPNTSVHDTTPVHTLPFMARAGALSVVAALGGNESALLGEDEDDIDALLDDPNNLWLGYANLIARSRVLRAPLATYVDVAAHERAKQLGVPVVYRQAGDENDDVEGKGRSVGQMLTLRKTKVDKKLMKPYLWSNHAFYKWSAWTDNQERYAVSLNSEDEKYGLDFWGMPFRKVTGPGQSTDPKHDSNINANLLLSPITNIKPANKQPRMMFLMPWIQMGGSEKCMLDVAERLVTSGWAVTFVLTMPFWHGDHLGELSLQNEWLGKAQSLTSDVFDIVQLAPNHKVSKVLRYLLESRQPDYILTANARVVYEHLAYVKQVSPHTLIADYNHMVHMDWEVSPGLGGGMPRYGATYTESIDLHLTASDNVTTSMRSWIDDDVLREAPEKVQTCYIGTDPNALHSDAVRPAVRRRMRSMLGIDESRTVVLFAGRYVADKGIDVMGEVVRRVALDTNMASNLAFVFVGAGEQADMLSTTQSHLLEQASAIPNDKRLQMILQPPAVGLDQLRDYYAMADVFLLPSNNEGIALVLYEAMAAGLLVMGTDVGGQNELIRSDTGVLLPLLNNVAASASFIVQELQAVLRFPAMFADVRERGTQTARERFTTKMFVSCVVDSMIKAKKSLDNKLFKQIQQTARAERKKSGSVAVNEEGEEDMVIKKLGPNEQMLNEMRPVVADVLRAERVHGLWNARQAETKRDVSGHVTIGVKTYVCDASIVRQVVGLVRSIRVNYKTVRILLANDGPTRLDALPGIVDDPFTEEVILPADSGISIGRNVMVNMTTTEFFVLLDDDHVFDDDTDLALGVSGLAYHGFDIVGIRVRNLPGIDELERIGIFIPRYVATISNFENRLITLCVWNENNGPGVKSMTVPIRVDVLHNALIARTDALRRTPWRNELKVNEHMTFFLDLRKRGTKVGYLPAVFVHHRARRYSDCYTKVRFREDKYETMLEYKDEHLWDVPCGDDFPNRVEKHLEATKDS